MSEISMNDPMMLILCSAPKWPLVVDLNELCAELRIIPAFHGNRLPKEIRVIYGPSRRRQVTIMQDDWETAQKICQEWWKRNNPRL